MISLITMGQGNVKALKKTMQSFAGICDEVIYGDMLLFHEDRDVLDTYKSEFNIKVIGLPFNYIFKNGFSETLNTLAKYAKNDLVMYMNTSEVIDEDYGITDIVKNNHDCNSFYFIHRTDRHRWFRTYNRKELRWSGLIHEQLIGEYRPYHKPIFMMKDLEKDMDSELKASVFNSAKEIVYFSQYLAIVDDPSRLGETNEGWLAWAKADYESFKARLLAKGKQYVAYQTDNYHLMMHEVYYGEYFRNEVFKSSLKIEFQGDPMFLGKTKEETK
jgi:hypothetical protein